jgi:hypothetical protein
MFNRAVPPPPYGPTGSGSYWSQSLDAPYRSGQDVDLVRFTSALVASGYRLYEVRVPGVDGTIARQVRVWAKSEPGVLYWRTHHLVTMNWDGVSRYEVPVLGPPPLPDLSRIAEGEVRPLSLVGAVVKETDYILVDDDDGGVVVQGGRREPL